MTKTNQDKLNSIEEVLESVFLHGKETPGLSFSLPEGQLTIVDAINQLSALKEENLWN